MYLMIFAIKPENTKKACQLLTEHGAILPGVMLTCSPEYQRIMAVVPPLQVEELCGKLKEIGAEDFYGTPAEKLVPKV